MRFLPALLLVLPLIAFLLLIEASPKAHAAADEVECWAVVIGVADYASIYIDDLPYADDDAEDTAAELSSYWGQDHVKLLVDSSATKANIQDAITGWLDSREDADDVVLFSFCGHGTQYSGHEYLCPYDSSSYSYTYDIRDTQLDSWLDQLESDKLVVTLDSCHSGGFISELSQGGRVVLASSGKYESSWESSALGHGIFSYYILQGFGNLEAVDANNDYEISAEELFYHAKPEVTAYEPTQHPDIGDSYSGELALLHMAVFDISPRIASMTIDGVTYSASELPVSLIGAPGSTHDCVVPLSVEEGTIRYAFSLWSGGDSSASITISQPGAYTASYAPVQYYLTVWSDYGTPQGEGWYDAGSTANISVTSQQIETLSRHFFTGWSGDCNATTTTATVLMDEPKTVTANWRHEYLLTVVSNYGTPQGEGWYPEGSTANISVASPEGWLIQYFFTRWSGSSPSTSTKPSTTITMDESKTVVAKWRTDYTRLYILLGGIAGSAIVVSRIIGRKRGKGRQTSA